jgi:hypothetical protein
MMDSIDVMVILAHPKPVYANHPSTTSVGMTMVRVRLPLSIDFGKELQDFSGQKITDLQSQGIAGARVTCRNPPCLR